MILCCRRGTPLRVAIFRGCTLQFLPICAHRSPPFAAMDEWRALLATLAAFYNFQRWLYEEIVKPRVVRLGCMSDEERQLLPWYERHTRDLAEAVAINAEFCRGLATVAAGQWGVDTDPSLWAEPSGLDFDKVRSTLLQFGREWSSEGAPERLVSYGKIIAEATNRFPDVAKRPQVNVLVPGCSLGRLVYEFVHHGFRCQGNEHSYHMLLASNYVLNSCQFANEHSVLPYIYKASHTVNRRLQLRPVTVPEVSARDVHEIQSQISEDVSDLMSMAAGSFTELYGPEEIQPTDPQETPGEAIEFRRPVRGAFDMVCTCFFLDTAANVIDYLKTIRHCLKDDGVWINFGPLLWHFEDDASVEYTTRVLVAGEPPQRVASTRKGMELSREDLLLLMEDMGFILEKHESGIKSGYSGDPRAMGGYEYQCEYWVARKREVKG